ncbi:MAG TPA: DUF1538 family protein, partial [Bacilli bacterium]|nr:DUF1538 family protein [Bacilli bacterium]
MNKILKEKVKETLQAILPVAVVILIISLAVRTKWSLIGAFVIGVVLLMVGLMLFSIGSASSLMPIAEGIGRYITKRKSLALLISVTLLMGFLITAAEPDLWVLASQFVAIPTPILILTVSLGVGVSLVISLLRIIFQIRLSV